MSDPRDPQSRPLPQEPPNPADPRASASDSASRPAPTHRVKSDPAGEPSARHESAPQHPTPHTEEPAPGGSGMGRRLVLGALLSVLVVISLLWLAGKFSPKIDPALSAGPTPRPADPTQTVAVRAVKMPVIEEAIGSVRAASEVTFTSRLSARITEMNLKAGEPVKQGQVLVRLDDTDLRARLEQSKAMLTSASAIREQAERDEKRLVELIETGAASQQDYERAATRLRGAVADVQRSEQAIAESEAVLTYTTLIAPIDGVVVDRRVEPGDTVQPGQVLLTMYDPHRMQLVASVRESLAYRLKVGQEIGVRIDAMNLGCEGTISEIVPEAQAASRTFQVKVTGPCPPGIYSGMSGRLQIELDERTVLLVPAAAIRRVGQLQLVDVDDNGSLVRRAVRTGRTFESDVEILSGLAEGERVSVRPQHTPEGA